MLKILLPLFILLLSFLVLPVHQVQCGDLDDGISKYTDDSIQKFDELGKVDKNVTFIKMNSYFVDICFCLNIALEHLHCLSPPNGSTG